MVKVCLFFPLVFMWACPHPASSPEGSLTLLCFSLVCCFFPMPRPACPRGQGLLRLDLAQVPQPELSLISG